MTPRVRPLLRLLPLAATVLLAACAETRYEGATTSTTLEGTGSVPGTAASVPLVGGAAELLPVLVVEATDLSRRMIEHDDPDAAAARIDLLWQAARGEVEAKRPELVENFDANVRRIATAVEFDRAADADKAGANLRALVDAYIG